MAIVTKSAPLVSCILRGALHADNWSFLGQTEVLVRVIIKLVTPGPAGVTQGWCVWAALGVSPALRHGHVPLSASVLGLLLRCGPPPQPPTFPPVLRAGRAPRSPSPGWPASQPLSRGCRAPRGSLQAPAAPARLLCLTFTSGMRLVCVSWALLLTRSAGVTWP